MTTPDTPPPALTFDNHKIGSVRSLIHQLMEAERAALLEGQDILPFWNCHPLSGLEVRLQRCADGKLALQIDGLD